jgi:hypothetical protein
LASSLSLLGMGDRSLTNRQTDRPTDRLRTKSFVNMNDIIFDTKHLLSPPLAHSSPCLCLCRPCLFSLSPSFSVSHCHCLSVSCCRSLTAPPSVSLSLLVLKEFQLSGLEQLLEHESDSASLGKSAIDRLDQDDRILLDPFISQRKASKQALDLCRRAMMNSGGILFEDGLLGDCVRWSWAWRWLWWR